MNWTKIGAASIILLFLGTMLFISASMFVSAVNASTHQIEEHV